jgi:hypothetical protein
MALSAGTLEKALRRLLAVEQKIDLAREILNALAVNSFPLAGQSIPMTAAQRNGLNTALSTGVVALEARLAGWETEVRGSTTILLKPAGAGITDFSAARQALVPLLAEASGPNLRRQLLEDIYRNILADRDADGELTAFAADPQTVALVREQLEMRMDATKLALAQLRALGA